MVEDFGLLDNLMIVRGIREAGGDVVVVKDETAEPLAAFGAFEACLMILRDRHGPVR